MKEQMKSLLYSTKATDVTEEGIVTVAVNGIGIEDAQHDISMPGSFVDTLANDMGRMRWFLNHDTTQLLGVPLSGKEEAEDLVMVGKINLGKQIGRDTLADYKLFAENGRTLEHSIGVMAQERDRADRRKVTKWKMLEYSTLTGWGANPRTRLVGIKSGTGRQVAEAAELLRKAMLMHGYSDERLKQYDMELNLLLKAISGGTIVACPLCGHKFDYDEQPERTFTQEVRDAAAEYARWIAQGAVAEEMERLRPEIREQVAAVLGTYKGGGAALTEKAVADLLSYVRCPRCWAMVHRHDAVVQPDPGEAAETAEEAATEKADGPAPNFWASLNKNLNIH